MALYFNYNKKSKIICETISIIFLSVFAIFTLLPLYFMIVSSFGDPVEAGDATFTLFPRKFTLSSYFFFFNYSKYSYRWILNSLIVASIVTISNVIFASMAGYAFSKMKFPGRNRIFSILLFSMMVPYQVIQVPLYVLVVNTFQIPNTYLALVLPDLCTVYNIFLAKQFISTLPTAIIDSAKIDGCNQFQIFTKIILPLSKTVLSVMAILTFMGSWNSFLWPLLVTTSADMQTIQVGLTNFRFANTTYFAPMMAGATISALPMFILFFSLQKYFLQGVTIGAIKG
ncbi:carbohydrate ABC transporter permease [Thermoanaerobacterium thermosaccharolyticum]|uniref:carbohydrate ABC transporter permease n=1 Tax=Thermoanaerobacterium thermosaccharolyticum TaxID=1517 RepID=UPI0020A325E6|nr:carbohydrate ABC transporter permease [Thermoanaerobacterium thermosaccharolyticum]MCP2241180.1 multiple sugar transport system permease protein [Thermoanaerobacterium thermosaccharolyticum]